jgi:hypothetical protein
MEELDDLRKVKESGQKSGDSCAGHVEKSENGRAESSSGKQKSKSAAKGGGILTSEAADSDGTSKDHGGDTLSDSVQNTRRVEDAVRKRLIRKRNSQTHEGQS